MKVRRTCFISFIKLLFSNLTKRKTIYEARINFIHETVNSHNLETANHIAYVILTLHSAMKTHLLIYQTTRSIEIIF